MAAIFNPPMTADGMSEQFHSHGQTAYVVTGLGRFFAVSKAHLNSDN
jgi:hypothetical protein